MIDNEHEKGFKTLTLDIDYYQPLLDDPGVSEDQKREFIETLWTIVVQFVDMGFGIHPIQQTDAGLTQPPQSLRQLINDCAATHTPEKKEKTLEGA